MKIKLPSYLYGSWLLSLTLLLSISAPVLAQSKMKTESQIEAERTERQVLSPAGVITGQTSNRPIAFPAAYNVFCIPEGTNAGRYIDNFSTTDGSENISNMGSGFSTDGYGDFYDTHTVTQEQGETVEFSVDIEGGTAGFRVWVDWNQDGEFDEIDEVAYASTGYQNNQTGSITVPSDALEGDTRMRIVSHWSSQTGDVDPCKTGFTYGEFEDYKFTVEGTIGIEVQSTTSFSYYPNPTNGVVNITANKDISSVAVYNILGQQVLDKDRLDNGEVDVSALSTGTYLFRVMFEDGSMETFKVLRK